MPSDSMSVTHTEATFSVVTLKKTVTLWRILGLKPTAAVHPISHFIKVFFIFLFALSKCYAWLSVHRES